MRLTALPPIDGFDTAYFRASGHLVLFVGDLGQPELLQLGQALGDPLYQALVARQGIFEPTAVMYAIDVPTLPAVAAWKK